MTLYHGTRAPFGKGGLVLPGALVDRDNARQGGLVNPVTGEPWSTPRNDKVYVTTDLDLAKDFARHSAGRGKAKVFEVRYVGEIERDYATFGGEERESYRVDEARIVRRVWIEGDEDA